MNITSRCCIPTIQVYQEIEKFATYATKSFALALDPAGGTAPRTQLPPMFAAFPPNLGYLDKSLYGIHQSVLCSTNVVLFDLRVGYFDVGSQRGIEVGRQQGQRLRGPTKELINELCLTVDTVSC